MSEPGRAVPAQLSNHAKPRTDAHVESAVIQELLHNAALLHDDVLDGGCIRRGVPTINQRQGNRTTVLLGDLLDIAGDGEALRKTLGTDLCGAKLTLPLIHALQALPESRRASLLLKLRSRSATAGELLTVFRGTGSIEYVLRRPMDYADEALDALHHVPETPAKTALMDVPRWIVQEAEGGTTISDRGSSVPLFHSQS
jgi:geranylgeranyl pyrophosphate synthase